MAEFTTTEISGIASAIKWMRFPLGSEGDSGFINCACTDDLENGNVLDLNDEFYGVGEGDNKLMRTLASAKPGSGHDCFLKAITVHYEVEAPHYWWNQVQRYHFNDIASSTSKMHSITKGDIGDKCSKWVSSYTTEMVNGLISFYNGHKNIGPEGYEDFNEELTLYCDDYNIQTPSTPSELFECILDNTPLGYQLKAGMVTNYLQLKTMYAQRKNHKLSHWNTDFVEWVHSLPMHHLITGE